MNPRYNDHSLDHEDMSLTANLAETGSPNNGSSDSSDASHGEHQEASAGHSHDLTGMTEHTGYTTENDRILEEADGLEELVNATPFSTDVSTIHGTTPTGDNFQLGTGPSLQERGIDPIAQLTGSADKKRSFYSNLQPKGSFPHSQKTAPWGEGTDNPNPSNSI